MTYRDSPRTQVRGHAGTATLLLLPVMIFCLLLSGCGRSRPSQVSYGPFGPVELSAAQAASLAEKLDSLAPSSGGEIDPAAWPLSITLVDGKSEKKVAVWPLVMIVDGEPKGDPGASADLAESVRAAVLGDGGLAGAIESCGSVTLVAGDVGGLQRELTAEERSRLAEAFAGSPAIDPGGAMGSPPYPAYQVTLDWQGAAAQAAWSGNGWFTLKTGGVFGDLAWQDADSRGWETCSALLPAPAADQAAGLVKLFAATGDVVASGGDLGQPVVCGASRAAGIVRLLLKGEPTVSPTPVGDPVTLTFIGPTAEWDVSIYDDGLAFEGRYYSHPGIKRVLLTTMSAGY